MLLNEEDSMSPFWSHGNKGLCDWEQSIVSPACLRISHDIRPPKARRRKIGWIPFGAGTETAGLAQALSKKGHPIEFVLKGGDDDGSPLPTKDMQGRATVQDGGKTATVPLAPAGPNMMVGKVETPLGPKARIVFSASFRVKAHTHTLTARYVTE
jgi:hypothetical protein